MSHTAKHWIAVLAVSVTVGVAFAETCRLIFQHLN